MKNSLQLSKSEIKMMDEIFEVMSRYSDKTRVFGVHLVHTHFPINQGEVLYETHDKDKRELKIVPKRFTKKSEIPLATAWNNINGKVVVAMFCCDGGGGDDGGGIVINIPK